MSLTVLLALLLLTIAVVVFVRRRRASRAAAAAAAQARARAAARRNSRVPAVSNNVKGVTASQTIEPQKPAPFISLYDDEDDRPDNKDERAA